MNKCTICFNEFPGLQYHCMYCYWSSTDRKNPYDTNIACSHECRAIHINKEHTSLDII